MNMNEYQEAARKTAIYDRKLDVIYPALGLGGESGEVLEKVKKVLRDKGGVFDEEAKEAIKKELGDVMWYIANIACDLNLHLGDIAQANVDKLKSRQDRNKLHGSGDNR